MYMITTTRSSKDRFTLFNKAKYYFIKNLYLRYNKLRYITYSYPNKDKK